jgi:hypothetical protein
MSFLTDLFEGDTSNLGNDISHAGSSLMSHPDELAETLGGAAALATGGLALGGELPFLGAGAAGDAAASSGVDVGGLFSGMFGDTSQATAALGTSGDSLIAPALNTGADVPGSLSSYASTAADASGGVPLPQAAPGYGGPPADAFGNPIGGGPSPDPYAGGSPSLGSNPSQGGGLIGPQAPTSPGSSFFSGITNSIMNPTLGGVGKVAGVAAAGAGLGFDLLRGNPTDPNQQQLQAQAGQLSAQGQQLESYLKNGTLPPALQAQLKQATSAEKARIVSGYAARGQPTDPNQNSALAQELNAVDTNAIAAMADAQIQLLNTGIKETGMSTEIYNILTKLDMQNNQQLMQAISSFAAALGGGGGGQTVRLAT